MDFARTLKAEVALARQKVTEAETRYRLLQNTLQQYQRLAQGNGSDVQPRAKKATAGKQRRNRAASGTRSKRASTVAGKTNKTAMVGEIVADHHASGATGRDVIAAVRGRSVSMSENAVFAALSKLKQRKLTVVRDGRYFPTESLLHSQPVRRKVTSS